MKLGFRFIVIFFATILGAGNFSGTANAKVVSVRWTFADHSAVDFDSVLKELNQQLSLKLTDQDFFTYEEKDLATAHFQTRLQLSAGIPIRGAMIRLWSDLATGKLIQMEANLEDRNALATRQAFLLRRQIQTGFALKVLTPDQTLRLMQKAVQSHISDRQVRDVKWRDEWNGNRLERVVVVRARRGTHTLYLDADTATLIRSTYELYPQADLTALVYPIYEEASGHLQARVPKTLTNLRDQTYDIAADPYLALKGNYTEKKMDAAQSATPAGQAAGFWSMQLLKAQAKQIRDQIPQRENSFARGMILDGLYTSINIHPEAVAKFGNQLNFQPAHSAQFYPQWKTRVVAGDHENFLVPASAYLGVPLTSAQDGVTRSAERLPNHDVAAYMNSGFDELQVYYAVNQLMDSLHAIGFTDPELSTRPFNAFLFDPDISMKNNAYYTEDTINFTTYSPQSVNFARDNSTIWHELGHGVMDRLMGDLIQLSDSGGLSEGMADFVAALVIQDVTAGAPFEGSQDFRIINRTSFHVTNEAHDDGEAYGGAMKDFLDASLKKYGQAGLIKIADVTLEAMRLARNHPSLDANAWFDHVFFADARGSAVRAPNELAPLLTAALESRNFRMDHGQTADFHVKYKNRELDSFGMGSRARPVPLKVKAGKEESFPLTVQLESSSAYAFKYPVKIEVAFAGGALQGPVHWKNKEAGSLFYVLNSDAEVASIPLTAVAKCDSVNLPNGGCSDYAYIRVWNSGENHPTAKKRFYVQMTAIQGN